MMAAAAGGGGASGALVEAAVIVDAGGPVADDEAVDRPEPEFVADGDGVPTAQSEMAAAATSTPHSDAATTGVLPRGRAAAACRGEPT